MKKILVPTDFSKPARIAVDVAVDIAKAMQAELILLHIVEQPTSDSYNVGGEVLRDENWEDKMFTMKLIEKSGKQLDQAVELASRSGITVRKELRLGNPYHGIDKTITDHAVDLVVMGTEGHSTLDKMLIGSNTEKVVRHSKCPVLTIHRKPKNVGFKNIVYATSMVPEEERFSRVVVQLQLLFDSTLHIVWVNTHAGFQPDSMIKATMQDFATRLQLKNYTLNVCSDYSEKDGILHFAESIDADLIAMSTHGRSAFAQLLNGSIAEDVAERSSRPVLTAVNKGYDH